MSMMFVDQAIEALRANLRGELIDAGSPQYDEVRAVYNAMIDRRPALIARCVDVGDVIAAVTTAPGSASAMDGVVIDLSPMKGVRVDPEARTRSCWAGTPGPRSTTPRTPLAWPLPTASSRRLALGA